MDENTTIKPGDGWVASGVPGGTLWLAEELEPGGREVKLVRWRGGSGGELVREENHASVLELLRADRSGSGWRRASDSEVEALIASLSRTDAADQVHGLQQRAREAGVKAEGRAIDQERLGVRQAAAAAREEGTAVPALDKMLWKPGPPQTLPTGTKPAGEVWPPPGPVRADAPMQERAGLVPPRKVTFPHDYPGAPGNPTDPAGWTSDCEYGCGAYAGPSTSGSRDKSVDPFGECPKHPELLAIKGGLMYQELMEGPLAELEAIRRVLEDRERQQRQIALAEQMEELGSRMIYEARELRRTAGVSDEEHAADMITPTTNGD